MEATEIQIRAAAELLRRDDAKDHFLDFVKYTKANYTENWHHKLVCDALESVERAVKGKTGARLLVRMPPRGGKSELVSRKFPAWFLGRNPELEIIATSYNGDLAADFGGEARDTMASQAFKSVFEDVELRADSRGKSAWSTKQGGHYVAAGVGEGITGKGAHVLIIDDPYKDAKEAYSTTIRKNVWDWYTSTAYTRLAPGGAVIVLLTSWHEKGLDHEILKEAKAAGETWEIIDIPAIMEAGYKGKHALDPRTHGESYWESRWPAKTLLRTKALIGSYKWSALFQQRPSPEDGGIVKRSEIRLWERLPDSFDEVISSWDLAFKGEAQSSRVARHLWGKKGSSFYLIWREAPVQEFKDTLSDFRRWAKDYPEAIAKIVEDKANGPALQSVLQEEIPGIIMIPKEIDKPGALRSVARLFEAGNVYLPNPEIHPWSQEIIDELVTFPNSAYDDDADAGSQALRYWTVPNSGNDSMTNWEL